MIQQQRNQHLENLGLYERTNAKFPSQCDGMKFSCILLKMPVIFLVTFVFLDYSASDIG